MEPRRESCFNQRQRSLKPLILANRNYLLLMMLVKIKNFCWQSVLKEKTSVNICLVLSDTEFFLLVFSKYATGLFVHKVQTNSGAKSFHTWGLLISLEGNWLTGEMHWTFNLSDYFSHMALLVHADLLKTDQSTGWKSGCSLFCTTSIHFVLALFRGQVTRSITN